MCGGPFGGAPGFLYLEGGADGGFQVFRGGGGGEARDGLAVAADEEFGEVPFDGVAGGAGCGGFEEGVEGVGFGAVHVDFGHEGEGDAEVEGAEGLDLFFRAGFLAAKLVAGEADDGKALGAVGFVQFLQACVLFGEAAFAGDVDDEPHFALQLRERERLAVGGRGREGIDGHMTRISGIGGNGHADVREHGEGLDGAERVYAGLGTWFLLPGDT